MNKDHNITVVLEMNSDELRKQIVEKQKIPPDSGEIIETNSMNLFSFQVI